MLKNFTQLLKSDKLKVILMFCYKLYLFTIRTFASEKLNSFEKH